jgi:hypothetical protein
MKTLLNVGRLLYFVPSLFCFCMSVHATTRTSTNCTAAAINTQIRHSRDGDTVLVNSSTCNTSGTAVTWSADVTINVGITFDGQGAFINIMRGKLIVNADFVTNTFVTGFNFLGAVPPTGSTCPICLNTSSRAKPYRFYGNTLNDNGVNGTMLRANGIGQGLIDHNTFTGNQNEELTQLYGSSPTDSSTWTSDVVPGSANMVFMEDNTFINTQCSGTTFVIGMINNYYGTRLVFRHNTVRYGVLDFHGGDVRGDGHFSSRWAEIYQNTFEYACYPSAAVNGYGSLFDMRGGSGVFWGNHLLGSPGSNPAASFNIGPYPGSSDKSTTNGGTWPVPAGSGRGIIRTRNYSTGTDYHYSPFYAWGNDNGSCPTNCPMGSLQARNSPIVSVGTASVDAAHCSTNPGNLCDGIDTGSSAPTTLVRCQSVADVASGCPVSYTYTPYTYPHPLQTGRSQAP